MNRIRTIAKASIVAGSVALAAAFMSPGGVGASFVDAAEASSTITVANQFSDVEPTGCTFDFSLPDWPGWSYGKDRSGTFNPSDFAKDLGDGTFGTTLDFSVAAPGADGLDLEWSDKSSDGDLSHSISFDKSTHRGSIAFWWPHSPDHHVWGTAFIEFLCTVVHDFNGFDHEPGSGDTSLNLSSKSDNSLVSGLSSSDGDDSGPSAGGDGDAPDSTTNTFSFEAAIDLPADPGDEPGLTSPPPPTTSSDVTQPATTTPTTTPTSDVEPTTSSPAETSTSGSDS